MGNLGKLVQFPVGSNSLLQNFQTGSRVSAKEAGEFFLELKRFRLETDYFHPVPRLRMSGVITPHPAGLDRENFNFVVNITLVLFFLFQITVLKTKGCAPPCTASIAASKRKTNCYSH